MCFNHIYSSSRDISDKIRMLNIEYKNVSNDFKNIKRGELVWMEGHVGIYVGENKFIHASYDMKKVIVSDLDDYWLSVLVASRDILSGLIKEKNI